MAKKSKIVQPGDNEAVQLGLFAVSSDSIDDSRMVNYPKVYRDEEGFKKVVREAGDMVGLDFEFNTKTLKPTVIGVSNLKECASVFYTQEIMEWLEAERKATGFIYSGHAVLTADRQVLESATKSSTTLSDWSDSMLQFWLANADLCKNPGKEVDEEGGLGFMGLGTMGSLTTDLPHHKTCRGKNCEELICPRHDVRGYCAVDAYVGLHGDYSSRNTLKAYGVPESSITFIHELQELTAKMSAYGVKVDREYVATLAKGMEEEQEKLFPAEGAENHIFNPRSPKAIFEWGKANKIFFPGTDKDNVQTILEKVAAENGYIGDKFDEVREQLDANLEGLDPTLSVLYRLYTYKVLGKGTDSWFHDRYFGADGLLHPRFVVTGTSTGRFSSSRPNYQNIPKRGWGKRVRRAFIPRDPGSVLVEADFSQLELRVCLYLAGVDQSIIGSDAFSWLVSKSGGLFEKAAQRYGGKPRDIAKSISHAADYLEGLRLLEPSELDYARTKSEVAAGALRVYHPRYYEGLKKEWTFNGKIVAFTGSNLAQRLFGSKTFENRKKALEIQEDIYFAAFPQIRAWQQRALGESESRGYVMSPAGRFLRLNDTPEKNAKIIVAFLGQGVGASHAQSVMLEIYKRTGTVFLGQIHDAFLKEASAGDYRKIYQDAKLMEMETPLLPGFTCPVKVEVGAHWGAMEELEEKDGEMYLGGRRV
jgi:hypothetical protein